MVEVGGGLVEKVASPGRTQMGKLINHWGQYICPNNSSDGGSGQAVRGKAPGP